MAIMDCILGSEQETHTHSEGHTTTLRRFMSLSVHLQWAILSSQTVHCEQDVESVHCIEGCTLRCVEI